MKGVMQMELMKMEWVQVIINAVTLSCAIETLAILIKQFRDK